MGDEGKHPIRVAAGEVADELDPEGELDFENSEFQGVVVAAAVGHGNPEPGKGKVLYFSSVRPGGFAPDAAGATIGDSDLYGAGLRRSKRS